MTSALTNGSSMFTKRFPQSTDEKLPIHSLLAHPAPEDKKELSKFTKALGNKYTVENLLLKK